MLNKKISYATEKKWNPIKTWLHCTQSIIEERIYFYFSTHGPCQSSHPTPHSSLPQWQVQKIQEKLLFLFLFGFGFLYVKHEVQVKPTDPSQLAPANVFIYFGVFFSSCQFRSPPLHAQACKCVRQWDETRRWLWKGEWDLKLCVWSFEFRRTMGRGRGSWQGERKGQTFSGCKHCLRVWGEAALPQRYSRTIWEQRGKRWEGQRAEMRENAHVIQAERVKTLEIRRAHRGKQKNVRDSSRGRRRRRRRARGRQRGRNHDKWRGNPQSARSYQDTHGRIFSFTHTHIHTEGYSKHNSKHNSLMVNTKTVGL